MEIDNSVSDTTISSVSKDVAVPVVHQGPSGEKITKVTIITNKTKLSELRDALEKLPFIKELDY